MRILYKIANKLFRIVKKILKLLTSRMVIIGVALLLEFCWLAGIVMQLNEKSVYINYAVTILSLIAVLSIINNPKMNPGYKLMWAVCILALPVTGICLYGILGHSSVARKFRTHYDTVLILFMKIQKQSITRWEMYGLSTLLRNSKRQNTTFLWNISSSARGICGIRCWRF